MSVSASMDFVLVNHKVKPIQLIQAFNDCGWNFEHKGEKEYIPLGDRDEFCWKCESLSDEDFFKVLLLKQDQNEPLGIMMLWQQTEIGGSFHFWSKSSISIILNTNRKTLSGNVTDVNWYLTKVLPVFSKLDLIIESVTFSEHV